MSRKNTKSSIVTIGIDIGKNSSHLIGLSERASLFNEDHNYVY